MGRRPSCGIERRLEESLNDPLSYFSSMESPSISPNGELIQKDESIPPDSSNLADAEQVSDWKPQKNEYMVMYSISIISMMIALDATILVPVLPVCMQKLALRLN